METWPPPELDSQLTAISTQNNSDNKETDRSGQVRCNDKLPESFLNEKHLV